MSLFGQRTIFEPLKVFVVAEIQKLLSAAAAVPLQQMKVQNTRVWDGATAVNDHFPAKSNGIIRSTPLLVEDHLYPRLDEAPARYRALSSIAFLLLCQFNASTPSFSTR